jgi:hypothetical protein
MKIRWIALLGALSLVLAACGGTIGAASVQESGAVSDGIGVHGAWTVDIINPDGTLAEHTAFHNELTTNGAAVLASLLDGSKRMTFWEISLGYPGGTSPCGSSQCTLFLGDGSQPETSDASYDLQVSTVVLNGSTVLRLSGTKTAATDSAINLVTTTIALCNGDDLSADCPHDPAPPFTERWLDTPIQVAANQTIQVQVEISFGSLPTT